MFNKVNWNEIFDKEIREAIILGDYDRAETIQRIKTKCDRPGWKLWFHTCAYVGMGYAIIKESITILIERFK